MSAGAAYLLLSRRHRHHGQIGTKGGELKVNNFLAILGVTVFFIAIALGFGGMRLNSIGEGEHFGYVTAVDQQGFVYRNYRVYFKSEVESSQEDVYCVPESDEDLVKELRDFARSGDQILIKYHGIRGFGWHLCSQSEIDAVELINR